LYAGIATEIVDEPATEAAESADACASAGASSRSEFGRSAARTLRSDPIANSTVGSGRSSAAIASRTPRPDSSTVVGNAVVGCIGSHSLERSTSDHM
jgi:hypothetical protein